MNTSKIVKKVPNEDFNIDMQYPKLEFKNGIEQCYVVPEVLDRLYKIKEDLSKCGLSIKIWDAWRSFNLQKELFEEYSKDIIKEFNLEGLPLEEQEKTLVQFVSKPVKDPFNAPLHTTAAAIDLTLIDADGNELEMGTKFDEFTSKTYTEYYKNLTPKIHKNRMILVRIMEKYGFRNLESEWWHFDFYVKDYVGIFNEEELNISNKIPKQKDEE